MESSVLEVQEDSSPSKCRPIQVATRVDGKRPTLVLIRGAQGSGKTTLAKALLPTLYMGVHFEADMFWKNAIGEYVFDAKRLGEAHEWCQRMARNAMLVGFDIIVSNTSITKRECQPYLDMAAEYDYTVWEIVCRGEFANTHGVPDDVVQKKRNQLELL